jgi:NAD(P)-dependent dehydrogenase (short-subunit alcohol dehydrogenase family)
VELGAAGATVYATGRSTRQRRSEYSRPETIEETAELVAAGGGIAIPVPTDHLVPEQVEALAAADRRRAGSPLDVLVNDIFGGDVLAEWDAAVGKHSLEDGLHLLRLAIDTHIITARYALPLLIRGPGAATTTSAAAPTGRRSVAPHRGGSSCRGQSPRPTASPDHSGHRCPSYRHRSGST